MPKIKKLKENVWEAISPGGKGKKEKRKIDENNFERELTFHRLKQLTRKL